MALPETVLRDPLSAVSRKDRRALLAVSLTGLTVVWTGLIPSQIATLGIQFSAGDRSSLLKLLALVILYFMVTFTAYAWADFIVWRLAYLQFVRSEFDDAVDGQELQADRKGDFEERLNFRVLQLYRVTPKSAMLRAAVDFVLPIAAAVWALVALARTW
jgi:hypothetical protein